MAPVKRPFDLHDADDGAGAAFDFDASIEVSMAEHTLTTQLSPTANKKFKLLGATVNVSPPKKDLAAFLHFDAEAEDALVPTAKELVNDDGTWLSESMPGSPVSVFHELPGDDSSSSDSDISDSSGLISLFDPPTSEDDLVDGVAVSPGDLLDDDEALAMPPLTKLSSDHMLLSVENVTSAAILEALKEDLSDDDYEETPVGSPMPGSTEYHDQTESLFSNHGEGNGDGDGDGDGDNAAHHEQDHATSDECEATGNGGGTKSNGSNRWAHNSTERKRRCEIRRLFSGLRDLFPELHGDDRISNINTLNRAITEVADLSGKLKDQETTLRSLRARNRYLKSKATKATKRTSKSTVTPAHAAHAVASAASAIPETLAATAASSSAHPENQTQQATASASPSSSVNSQQAANPQQAATTTSTSRPQSKQSQSLIISIKTRPAAAAAAAAAASTTAAAAASTNAAAATTSTDATAATPTASSTDTVPSIPGYPEAAPDAAGVGGAHEAVVNTAMDEAHAAGELVYPPVPRKSTAQAKAKAKAAKQAALKSKQTKTKAAKQAAIKAKQAAAVAAAKVKAQAAAKVKAAAAKARSQAAAEAKARARLQPRYVERVEIVYAADPLEAIQKGDLRLVSHNTQVRKAIPSALRQLLDHNGRGSFEAAPLPPRRSKAPKQVDV